MSILIIVPEKEMEPQVKADERGQKYIL